jgi:glycosyltransferase involved in cell wall biosynthesis
VAETAGAGARLVDPLDVAAIADALADVLRDEQLRHDLVRRGAEQAARYSVERTGREARRAFDLAIGAGATIDLRADRALASSEQEP